MRRSGKTTRLVNEVIETLFKEKIIYIPTSAGINQPSMWEKNRDKFNFIDPDHYKGNMAQNYFISRVIDRVSREHTDQVKIDRNGYRVRFEVNA